MPFTFSHAAATLPLKKLFKNKISGAGLIIGSIAPDFEYFIRLKSKVSHTLEGLLIFDLPVGILTWFIFFNIIFKSLNNNLPEILRQRLSIYCTYDWNYLFKKHWIKICISILIGASTHILWDSFTHASGYFVKYSLFFKQIVLTFPLYRLLQHISSILGGIIIVIYFFKLPKTKDTITINYKYWMICIVAICLFMIIHLSASDRRDIWAYCVMLISSVIGATTVSGIIHKIK